MPVDRGGLARVVPLPSGYEWAKDESNSHTRDAGN